MNQMTERETNLFQCGCARETWTEGESQFSKTYYCLSHQIATGIDIELSCRSKNGKWKRLTKEDDAQKLLA